MRFKISLDISNTQKSKKWPQFLAVLAGCLCGVSAGMHYTWPSPALPIILSDQFHVNITSEESSYIAFVAPFGDLIGAPLASYLAHTIGRKNGILFSVLPTVTAWLFIGFANSTLILCIGRLFAGIADGFLYILHPIYVAEVTEPSLRGVLGSSLGMSIVLGTLIFSSYGPFLSIQNSSLVALVVPALLITCFGWMPESPYYLIMKGKLEEAKRALYMLRRCDIEKEFEMIKNDVARQMTESGTLKDLFYIESNRKALFIVIGVRVFQQFSGMSAWAMYIQSIFEHAGAKMSPVLSACMTVFVQLVFSCWGAVLLYKYERRPLLLLSCFGAGVLLLIGGAYFYLVEKTDVDVSSFTWIPIAVMLMYMAFFSIGLATVPAVLLGEMFSTSVKGKALSSLCALSAGMHFTWTSPALPIILSDDFPLNITSEETSYIALVAPIGDLIGAPLAGWLADVIGRKNVVMLTALPTFIAWMIIAFAESTWVFCIGRIIAGIAEGFFYIIFPMYMGEVTEPSIRGVVSCSLPLSLMTGMLLINAYVPFLSIRDSSIISAVVPVLLIICFAWMPESPYYLIMKGKMEEAKKALYFLRRCDIDKDLEVLKNDVTRQMSEKGTLKDVFYIRSNRKAFFIVTGVRIFQQLSGLTAWTMYTQTIFAQAGAELSPVVATCIYSSTQLFTICWSSLLLEKFGRRPLLILSGCGCGVTLIIGGVYFYLQEKTDTDISSFTWIPIVVMLVYVIFFSAGLATVPSTKGKSLEEIQQNLKGIDNQAFEPESTEKQINSTNKIL
ncbi:uncharacterized protein CBL_05457 [Carabus blaptoides fortunei]